MESWRKTWRDGIAPQLSPEALWSLAQALQQDDPRLIQGATTQPPPLQCVEDWPVEAACALGFCAWQGRDRTVGQVEEDFARLCFECDQRLGEPAACRWFINWFDETDREEVRRELLPEVLRSLSQHAESQAPTLKGPVVA